MQTLVIEAARDNLPRVTEFVDSFLEARECPVKTQMLIDLGYNCGGADGSFGSATASALVAYQQDNGLYADAIAGPVTLDALQKSWAARGTATQAVSTQAPAAAVSVVALVLSVV